MWLIKSEEEMQEEFRDFIKEIENRFNCKVKINPSSHACLIHSKPLTLFFSKFFDYQKLLKPLENSEILVLENSWLNLVKEVSKCG